MKKRKRLLALALCVGMIFAMCGIESFAAGGQLRFSDPSTTVGATVDVTAKLSSDGSLGSVSATLTYDSQYLRFVGGSGAADTGGQIQLTGDGGGNSQVEWTMQFQALAEGSTQITIASVSAKASDGSDVSVTEGNSTVTIGPGDPSLIDEGNSPEASGSGGGGNIEIDGQSYTVSTDIPDILIPGGFVKADMTYGGQTYAATRQENGTIYAIYLANGEGEEDFHLYDPDTETFSPFEQIAVSDERYIVLLSEDKGKELPENLQRTSMTVNGKDFPAWQNVDASSYYVVYALNSDGEKGFYQYDTVDATYQRYTPAAPDKSKDKEDSKTGFLNRLRSNLDKVIMVAWFIFLIMLIVIIVLAVKLRHRNLELDELYDEYGIDMEEEEAPVDKKARKKAEKDAKKNKSEDDFFDFDDEDDLFDEDEYDEEDGYSAGSLEEEGFQEYDASDYEDDSDIDDLDAMLDSRVRVKKPAKRPKKAPEKSEEHPKKVGHAEDDDTFKMDLIDLD